MSEEVVNRILTLLREKPQYYDVLKNALEWHKRKFVCDKCGSTNLIKISDYLYKCAECGYEKMIFGFQAHEVKSMPAYLYKLYNAGILRITYKSRRYTNYLLADPEAVEKALAMWEKNKEVVDYNKPIEIPDNLFEDIVGFDKIKKTIIKALKSPKPIHILLVGPPACAKSVPGETKIIIRSDDGIEIAPISEVYERVINGEELYALSVNPKTLKTEWKRIIGAYRHKPSDKLIRITADGLEIIATKDHSFVKYDIDKGLLVPIRGADLRVGDLIPVVRHISTRQNNKIRIRRDRVRVVELANHLNVSKRKIYKMIRKGKIKAEDIGRGERERYRIPIDEVKKITPSFPEYYEFELDYSLGLFIGVWLGDGTLIEYKGQKFIEITSSNRILLEKIVSITKKYIEYSEVPENYEGGCITGSNGKYVLRIGNYGLYKLLEKFIDWERASKMKGKGRFSKTKIIPPELMDANTDFIRGLLRGIFTTDGTVSNREVCLTLENEELIHQISLLLRSLGINNKIRIKQIRYKDNIINCWELYIPSSYIKRFAELIGFEDEEKQKKLMEVTNNIRHSEIFVIPYTNTLHKLLTGENRGLSTRYNYRLRKMTEKLRQRSVMKGYVSRRYLEEYINLLKQSNIKLQGKSWEIISTMLNSDIDWVVIERIEEIEYNDYVYDISVEDNENFVITNGIVTHNSMIMEDLWKKIKGSHLILAGTSTKAGIRDVIAEYSPRLLLIDELDKINDPKDLSVLLSWMEHQRIVITMRDRYEMVKCKYVDGCKVIAACNNDRYIPPELKSRFLIIRIKPYTEEEFLAIVKHVLTKREGKDPELAEYIGKKVLTVLHSRDPRDAVKVARLANSKEEVDEVIEMLRTYR